MTILFVVFLWAVFISMESILELAYSIFRHIDEWFVCPTSISDFSRVSSHLSVCLSYVLIPYSIPDFYLTIFAPLPFVSCLFFPICCQTLHCSSG